MNLIEFFEKEEAINKEIKCNNSNNSEIIKLIINKNNNNITNISNNNKFITNKFISDLLNLAKIEDIEAGIVKYFLKKNQIQDIKNKFIKDIINKDPDDKVFKFLQRMNFSICLSDIEKIFELLIPPEDKRINGAVYTPLFIVDYIIENTIDKEGTVCDCSCGSGAFLLGALRRLKVITNKNIIEIIENNLFGADILDYAVRRTKIMLSLITIYYREDTETINFNLKVTDSLETDWINLFPEIFNEKQGFDFVVGNPPYVRIQDLGKSLKEKLYSKWKSIGSGNFNLYFAFFELGINILNKNGKLGYITPNNYFTSLAGVELRKYLSENKQITRILNFNHLKLFENASTYTCITFMKKDYLKDYFEYYYIEDIKELDSNLNNLKFSPYYYEWLDNNKWRLMVEKDYRNIKIIESIGTPLNELCPIKVGIATLKDVIYFVREYNKNYCIAEFRGKKFFIEKDITRKVVKISSIKNQDEIYSDKRRIIFPYFKKNGKYGIMPEEYLKQNFPKTYEYLLSAKSELEKRDKGKKSYPAWYAWGRTQAMDYKGKRLYTRTFSDKPDFMLDEQDDNLFCNGYALFCKKNIEAVQKILNSKLIDYYVKKTSYEIEGDYQCYQKNFIEKFNIPLYSESDWEYLEKEEDKNKIDVWLINKYGLDIQSILCDNPEIC